MCAAPREPDHSDSANEEPSKATASIATPPKAAPPIADPANAGAPEQNVSGERLHGGPPTARDAEPPLRTEPPWKLPGQPGAFTEGATPELQSRLAELRGRLSSTANVRRVGEPPGRAPLKGVADPAGRPFGARGAGEAPTRASLNAQGMAAPPRRPAPSAHSAPSAQRVGAPNVAQPPSSTTRVRILGATGLIGLSLIAGGVSGYMSGYVPRFMTPERLLPVSEKISEKQDSLRATTQVALREPVRAQVQTPLPRLTVDAQRMWQADEPAQLSIGSTDAGSNASVVINGLAPGSALWAGTGAPASAGRLNSDLKQATIKPPPGFVGVMNLVLELRLADDTVADRKSLQLEWAGKIAAVAVASPQPVQKHLDAAEIALLMKRGNEMVASGNIGAARYMFQPAAEAGEAAAAFALAETYDPLVLDREGAKGITSDIALAQRWYEKAKALGSTVAPERLVALARSSDAPR